MLEDVNRIAERLLGTTNELPPYVLPEELIPWGVERCDNPNCRLWVESGQIKDGKCRKCRSVAAPYDLSPPRV